METAWIMHDQGSVFHAKKCTHGLHMCLPDAALADLLESLLITFFLKSQKESTQLTQLKRKGYTHIGNVSSCLFVVFFFYNVW